MTIDPFINLVPHPGAAGVPVNTTVSFDVVDDGYGIDFNTLDVVINGGPAILNGQDQDGYSFVSTPITDGYNVVVTPDFDLPEATVINVSLEVRNFGNELGELDYSFKTVTDLKPEFIDIFPAPGSVDADENADISFTIRDIADNGILFGSITVYVNFAAAILGGEVQDGYSAQFITNPLADGYDVIISHDRFDAFSRIDVSITATNFDNNSEYLEYFYNVSEKSAPDILNQDPAAGATDVPLETDVCFDVIDQSGVDLEDITVSIDGRLAFQNSDFVYPFDDVNSSVSAIQELEFQSFFEPVPVFTPIPKFFPPVFFSETFFDPDAVDDGYYIDGYGDPQFDPLLVNDGYFTIDGYTDGYDGYDGYEFDGYELDGYDGYFPILTLGYSFCFDNRVSFKANSTIEVEVTATDLRGNEGTRSYSFSVVNDTGPPVFENVFPGPDSEGILLNTPLEFRFTDAFSGALLSSLDVGIGAANAIVNGVFSDGYTGSIAFNGDGYDVEINPPGGWPNYKNIDVSLFGEDCVGNSALFEFSFLTEDVIGPTFDNIFPAPGAIDVPTDTTITFEFNDANEIGSDQNTLNINILGFPVVSGGEAADGYSLVLTPNDSDGYDVELTLTENLPEFVEIDIFLSGYDNAGNFRSFEYVWKTADETAPSFGNISPVLADGKVSIKAPIYVDIFDDGSGANIDSLDVSVDNTDVIADGITLPNGFVTDISPIDDGYRLYIQGIGPVPHELDDDTIALYRMDTLIADNVVNATGNAALDGTATGATLTDGNFNKALGFSGGTDRVSLPASTDFREQNITIEAWINPSVLAGNHTIYSYTPRQTITDSRGLVFRVNALGKLELLLGDGSGVFELVSTGSGLVSAGVYTHVATVVSFADNDIRLYVNGQEQASVSLPIAAIEYNDAAIGLPVSAEVYIGTRVSPFSGAFLEPFLGDIDDLKISGVDRDKSYIANSYNRGLDTALSEFATIPVSIGVRDFSGNDGYINYSFATLDETPPVFDNLSPAAGAVGVDPATNVSFDFTDIHSGPDLDTLIVTIDGKVYLNGETPVGASVNITPITDGYNIDLDLDVSLPEYKNIVVTLDGYDIDPNQTILTYSFFTDDVSPPVLVNESPAEGEVEVNPFTDIKFTLHDFGGSGVDVSTVDIRVDGVTAFVDGYAQGDWSIDVDAVVIDGYAGFEYCIEPPYRLPLNKSIVVEVDGYDAYGNFAELDFAFTTFNDQEAPEIVNLDPASAETEVEIDSNISFEIIDGYDVDISRLDVYVNGSSAIVDGVFQAGYSGPASDISEIVDGYAIVIDPESNFAYNAEIEVVIDGYDFSNNHVSFEYSFFTFTDVIGPIISNRSPASGEVEVAFDAQVSFNITDPAGSGIDMNRLDVHINTSSVVVDGVIQSGWNGGSATIESITDGYRVVIDPIGVNEFDYNQINIVTIDGYDFANNHTNSIYSFATISDPNAPLLTNVTPAPSSTEVAVNTNISFDITDAISGVDMTRLDVFVNAVPAVTNGTITPPFSDSASGITTVTDGYSVVLDLFIDFDYGEVVQVIIDGYDNADNQVQSIYSFTTKVDVDGPTITPVSPIDDEVNVARSGDITLTLIDQETGVDFSGTDILINSVPVMTDGVFIPGTGFDGPSSSITQLLDGYQVFFDNTTTLAAGSGITIIVDGYDNEGNHSNLVYSFITIDDTGPVISNIVPEPNSVNVENDPVSIQFLVEDEGGSLVDAESIIIEIAEEDGYYELVYNDVNGFFNGWSGFIANAGSTALQVDMTKDEQGKSFSLFRVRVTVSDTRGNTSIINIGKIGGLIAAGTGTVTGAFTIDMGADFISDNQVSEGDIILVVGTDAFTVDGYTATEIVTGESISAGGSVEVELYRGSFMVEKRIFRPEVVTATTALTVDLTFSDPPQLTGLVLDPLGYAVSGGSGPILVTEVTQKDEDTFELTFDTKTDPLTSYTITVDSDDIINRFGESIVDGYESVDFISFPDVIGPKVVSAINDPLNINVTVIFDENIAQVITALLPANYLFSHGAYVTNVEFHDVLKDRVILTVENLSGRPWFEVFVSSTIADEFGNTLDTTANSAIVTLNQTTAALSGVTGRLKTKNAVKRLYEDSQNWYVGTEGGLDIVSKLELENVGYLIDAYGVSSITANTDTIYFGRADGYGVSKLALADVSKDSTEKANALLNVASVPAILDDSVNDLFAADDLLVVGTEAGATVVVGEISGTHYSSGNNIVSVQLDDAGSTLYLANDTLGRVEVYYGVDTNTTDKTTPDAYYDVTTSPEIIDANINQIKVTSGTSIIDSGSNTIYVATDDGLSKIETDESSPGVSEDGGISFSYGIDGSGAIYEVLGGGVNKVIAVDVNLEQRQVFVATELAGLTTINIDSNARFSFSSAPDPLISNDIRDVTFKNL